jgi:hypothetical protein
MCVVISITALFNYLSLCFLHCVYVCVQVCVCVCVIVYVCVHMCMCMCSCVSRVCLVIAWPHPMSTPHTLTSHPFTFAHSSSSHLLLPHHHIIVFAFLVCVCVFFRLLILSLFTHLFYDRIVPHVSHVEGHPRPLSLIVFLCSCLVWPVHFITYIGRAAPPLAGGGAVRRHSLF